MTHRTITMSLNFFPCKIPIPYDASYVYDACNVLVKSYSKSILAATRGIVLVKSTTEVIVLDRGIFLRERSSRRKIPRSKTITDEFTQWPKQRWCKVIIVINNRYFDNFVCFMCIFLNHEENSNFYHFYTHPCKRTSISPDVTIIVRCDKCANTVCIARDCLCIYAYARMALAIMPTSHSEVIIRSHCYVIMTAQFFAPSR